MRIFIAVDLPQEAKDELASVQKQLSAAAAKLSPAHDFHLTLKFLGEITSAKVDAVKNCLSRVSFKQFTATASGVGVFPSENYVRVVWIGLEPEDEFVQLQKKIDDALEMEFPKEEKFKPHITLARVKFVQDKQQFRQQLQQIKAGEVKFTVDSFKLKRSTLSGKGAVYEDLAVYKLG